jgi:hypothetical protein
VRRSGTAGSTWAVPGSVGCCGPRRRRPILSASRSMPGSPGSRSSASRRTRAAATGRSFWRRSVNGPPYQ